MKRRYFQRIARDESGQDMVEYGLILGLVSVVAILAVTATGQSVLGLWNTFAGKIHL